MDTLKETISKIAIVNGRWCLDNRNFKELKPDELGVIAKYIKTK